MEVAFRVEARLGEGPRWDAATRRLLWVDIEAGALHLFDPSREDDRAIPLGNRVGAAAPTGTGGVLVALADRLAVVDLDDESVRTLVEIPHGAGLRLNDGACDPAGRFWVGSMALDYATGAGALYRYSHSAGLERVLDAVTLSNGLGWSPDGETMYYVDSMTYRIDRFDFDPSTGAVSDRRPFVAIERGAGIPDGLAVDHEGGIWVALWVAARSAATRRAASWSACSPFRPTTSLRAASAAMTAVRSTSRRPRWISKRTSDAGSRWRAASSSPRSMSRGRPRSRSPVEPFTSREGGGRRPRRRSRRVRGSARRPRPHTGAVAVASRRDALRARRHRAPRRASPHRCRS